MSFDLRPCLAGDRRAWEAFVRRFAPVIYAAVQRTLRARGRAARDEVEDAAQDVFLRLVRDDFRLLRAYDPDRASLPTWLTIVARSAAIDRLRRRRIPAVPLEDHAVPPAPPAPEPAEPLELPPGLLTGRQQLVLTMLFERQMSVEEAAAALGVDTQTIRSTKHKAISRLREHLAGR